MAGRKSGGENTKKAAGNARKAEAAAAKLAARDQESERIVLEKWKQGAKDTSKAHVFPKTYVFPAMTNHLVIVMPQRPNLPKQHAKRPKRQHSSPKKKRLYPPKHPRRRFPPRRL